MSDMLDDLRRMQAELEALPPMPKRVMASHAVPYGRCYRQWMTNGDLVLWANRGEIADMPRVEKWGVEFKASTIVPPGFFGVQVFNA